MRFAAVLLAVGACARGHARPARGPANTTSTATQASTLEQRCGRLGSAIAKVPGPLDCCGALVDRLHGGETCRC